MDEMDVVRDIAGTLPPPQAEVQAPVEPVADAVDAAPEEEPQAEVPPQEPSPLFDERVAASLPDEKARLKYYHDTYSQKIQQAKEQAKAEAQAAAAAYQDMLARITAVNPQAAITAAEKAVAVEPEDPTLTMLAKLTEQGFDPEWAASIRDMVKAEAQRLVAPVLKQTEEARWVQTVQKCEAEMVSKYPDYETRKAAMDSLYASDPSVKRRIDSIPDPMDKTEVLYQTVVFRTLPQTVQAKAVEVVRQQAQQRAAKAGAEVVSGGGQQSGAPGAGPPAAGSDENDPLNILERITQRPPMFG